MTMFFLLTRAALACTYPRNLSGVECFGLSPAPADEMGHPIKTPAACEAAFLGRTSAPEEMAGAVAFMCCEDASFMTGETMIVGGGLEARL